MKAAGNSLMLYTSPTSSHPRESALIHLAFIFISSHASFAFSTFLPNTRRHSECNSVSTYTHTYKPYDKTYDYYCQYYCLHTLSINKLYSPDSSFNGVRIVSVVYQNDLLFRFFFGYFWISGSGVSANFAVGGLRHVLDEVLRLAEYHKSLTELIHLSKAAQA